MPVTLKQLAARVGVSVPTASLILNGKGERYSEATREAVLKAAADLGYRPNASARAMQSRRFRAAALLYRENQSFLPIQLLRGIGRGLEDHDMHLVLQEMQYGRISQQDSYTPKLLRELCVDGLIVFHALAVASRIQDLIREQGIPAVWLHQEGELDCVRPDDRGAVAAAVRRLHAQGHRRIAYLDCHAEVAVDGGYDAHRDRREGYRGGIASCGLEPWLHHRPCDPIDLHRDPDGSRLRAAHELLAAAPRPTAVLTPSPHEAVPLLLAAAERGLAVPAALSVVTVAERPATEAGIPLSTLLIPIQEEGAAAVDLLAARLASGRPQPSVLVPHREILGASTAPPEA